MLHINKVFQLLNDKEKFKLFFIFLLSTIAATLELIGIGMVLPVFAILLKDNFADEQLFLFNFDLNFFNDIYSGDILFLSLFFLVAAFFLKNCFLIAFNYYNNKFINDIAARTSASIFQTYIKKNFNFYLQNNSVDLIKNCLFIVDRFKESLSHIITMISEIIILLAIIILLIAIEPKGFLLSLIFLLALTLFAFFTSNKINVRWGKEIQHYEKERYLHLTQAFSAIREIIVFKKINFFFNKYLFPNKMRFQISYLHGTLSSVPRFLIEFFFILTLALLLIFLKFDDKSNYEILIIMGMFAVAAIRVIPSLNRILSSIQRIKFGFAPIDTLHDELHNKTPSKIENKTNLDFNTNGDKNKNYLINLENVSYKYDFTDNHILNNVNLVIKEKESFGIIGKTGSGKTTLINLILGLLKPTQGKIHLNFSKISFVPQSPYLIDDTILNNVALGIDKSQINIDQINKCLKDVQLEGFIKKLPNGIKTKVGEKGMRISGGELQRLAIARALYTNPELLIFDEPTNSLDKTTEKKIMEIIKFLCKKISIILVTHNPDNLEYCDQIIKIENNKIYFSKTKEREKFK